MKKQAMMAIGVSLIMLTGCEGQEGRKQKYRDQAQASYEAGEYDKARISYKNVLKIDPKDISALMGFGETLEKLEDWRGAIGRYRSVLGLNPEHVEARVKLGQLYLLGNANDLALEQAEILLARKPQLSAALTLKAGVFAKQGELKKALNFAGQAYKNDSSNVDAIVLLASLRDVNKDRAGALSLLEKEVQAHPNDIAIHALLARVYRADGDLNNTEKTLQTLVQLKPNHIEFKQQLALFYEENQRPEDAESVFLDVLDTDPGNTEAIEALNQLYVSRGSLDKAEQFLQKRIALNPDNSDLRFTLASFYVMSAKDAEAESVYNALSKNDSDAVAIKATNRLAFLLEKRNAHDEAAQLVDGILEDHPTNIEALIMRGTRYLRGKDALNAIADLRSVLSVDPDNAQATKLLAAAHLLNNEPALAKDLLASYINLRPQDIASRMQLAELLHKNGNTQGAIGHLDTVLNQATDDPTLLDKIFKSYMSIKQFDKAQSAAQRLFALDATNPLAHYYLGLIEQIKKKHVKAIAYFDEALALRPGAVEPISAKVKSMIALGKRTEAIAWLTTLAETLKTNPVAHNLRGELLLADHRPSQAKKAFIDAMNSNANWWVPYRNLALLNIQQKKPVVAMDILKQGIEATSGNLRLRTELAILAEKHNDPNEAIEQYSAVLTSDANNLIAVNNLALLLVEFRQGDEFAQQQAQQLADVLAKQDNPLLKDSAGWVYYKLGDTAKGKALVEQAYREDVNNAEINYHLGMILLSQNDKVLAKKHLLMAAKDGVTYRGKDNAVQTLRKL